jgi:hemerythrin
MPDPDASQPPFDTGVAKVDAEHHLQLDLVGALQQLVRRGGDPELVEKTMAQLADLSGSHFRSEELLMRINAYPELDAHRQEHVRLTDRVHRIRAELESGASARAVESIGAFQASLVEHIRGQDHRFARWCLEAAARDVRGL